MYIMLSNLEHKYIYIMLLLQVLNLFHYSPLSSQALFKELSL